MKLQNNGAETEIIYGGKVYTIPSGQMEIADDGLGYYIMKKANNWGLSIVTLSNVVKQGIESIQSIKSTIIKEEKVEPEVIDEVIEAPKETVRRGRPSKVKDLEDSL